MAQYNLERARDAQWASKADSEGRIGHRKVGKASRGFLTLARAFWGLCAGHRGPIVLALLTLTLTTGIGLLGPATTKIAIDYIVTDNPGPTGLPASVLGLLALSPEQAAGNERMTLLWALAGVMVLLAVVSVLAQMVGRWQVTRVTKRVQVSLRRRAFDHAIALPLHRVQQYKSGGMASLLREDAGLAAELLFTMVVAPWRAIVTLVGTLAVLGWTDYRLLLGGLLCVPTVWITHRTWIARIRPLFRDAKAQRMAVDAHATEAFAGLRVVRGFGRSRSESSRFVRGQHFMTRLDILAWWWSRGVEFVWSLLMPLASAGVMLYGGWAVMRGSLTIGDLMMFMTYLLMLLGPLEALTATAANIQSHLAALDRVLTLLEEPTEQAANAGTREINPSATRGDIELRGVNFTYPGSSEPVLTGIDLHARSGETIALVGPSGAGKTTLCNLIARFYEPSSGVVLLDGRNVRELSLASYRSILGIVEQDVFLFDGTLAQNIAYARPNASEAMIVQAARAANAHEFITKTEQGYETIIGERGVRLSGGQRQRIAIARAILADPRVLILDEATSNLDSESERAIQQSLATLMRGRTCFVIAHRLSTIRHAHQILVLDQGRILERGTHDSLARAGGLYERLLGLQDSASHEPGP